jgi:phosphocarrier protein FPr/phosphocarrier protein
LSESKMPSTMQTNHLELVAPLDGLTVPLSSVPDPVFAGLMMGDGLAIEPLSGTLLAPFDGVVTNLARSHHALSLRSDLGAEVLIHVGVDTVRLNGQGFTPRVEQGSRVRCGQPLLDIDLDRVARLAPSLLTMLVFPEPDWQVSFRAQGRVAAGQTGLLTVERQATTSDVAIQAGQTVSREAIVNHENGLHARPATLVQGVARRYAAQIQIHYQGRSANARSVAGLMGLGIGQGEAVQVEARGPDAKEAAQAVVEALQMHAPVARRPAQTQPAESPRQVNQDEEGLTGICASPGLAIGTVVRLDRGEIRVPEEGAGLDAEFARLATALQQVRKSIAEDAAASAGKGHEGDILNAHLALLDDPELIETSEGLILQGKSAGHAIRTAVEAQCQALRNLGIALFAERVADLRDIEHHLLAALGHQTNAMPELPEGAILLADDLLPSQLARLPQGRVAGLALAFGGATGHLAIIARSRGLPALVAVGGGLLDLDNGRTVLLDADNGRLLTDPDSDRIEAARSLLRKRAANRLARLASAGQPAHTLDGVEIEVAGNIADREEAEIALHNGADGIGLLRSEFLFMERDDRPSAAEQQAAYQAILDTMAGRPTTIRTIDIGADKPVSYLTLGKEDNPALGVRGIRLSLADDALFDDQFSALLRLTPLTKLRLMVPMVAEVSEVVRVKARIDQLAERLELKERPQFGVMIEVPSAALMAEQIAQYVDFFSVGTNDLTQYTLAMDRCNPDMAARLDQLHPAVLRLLAMTVDGARKHGKWVGVCGGAAGDRQAIPLLLGLGVSELSVAPPMVAEVKELVRSLSREHCAAAMSEILQLESAAAVRAEVLRRWPQCGQHGNSEE